MRISSGTIVVANSIDIKNNVTIMNENINIKSNKAK